MPRRLAVPSNLFAEAIHGLNELLEGDNRHFGYRVACEIARYVLLAHEQAGEAARDAAVDLAILYKVLPKLNGTQQELEATLDALFAFGVLGAAPSKRDIDMLRDDTDWVIERGRLVRPGKDDVSDKGHAAEVPWWRRDPKRRHDDMPCRPFGGEPASRRARQPAKATWIKRLTPANK